MYLYSNLRAYFSTTVCQKAKSQIILKGLLVFLNSPKKQMNEFIFTTMMNSSICCVQTQTRGEVVSPEHLPFASAYFCTTVFQKARATENLTFFKGQKKLKVDWRAIDSPKKWTNIFFAMTVIILETWNFDLKYFQYGIPGCGVFKGGIQN